MRNTRDPYLSLVTLARNDNYGKNFRWRLETTLNYIGRSAARLGRSNELEFVVVDWGSEVPLHSVLDLCDEARKVARFIIVPLEIAERFNQKGKVAGSIAINAGVRRSLGTYVAQTGGDVLYDEHFLRALLDRSFEKKTGKYSPEKTLFHLSCRNVPSDFVERNPSIEEVERYIESHGIGLKIQPLIPYVKGGAAALLMHKELWAETRGLDESWFGWGWTDVDLNLRVCLKYQSADFGSHDGLYGYHLDHPSSATPHTHKFNPFVVNPPEWGLTGIQLAEHPHSDIVMVPQADTRQIPETRHILFHHFLKYLAFLPTCRDRNSLYGAYCGANAIILSLRENNPVRRVYVTLNHWKERHFGA